MPVTQPCQLLFAALSFGLLEQCWARDSGTEVCVAVLRGAMEERRGVPGPASFSAGSRLLRSSLTGYWDGFS